MATHVQHRSSKHEAFITSQLERVEQRIRFIDVCTGLGGWLALSLAYLIVTVLLDRALLLAGPTRQTFFLVYAVASLVFLYFTVVRPLRWRVNPYYAARQLEQTLPGNRNHVINWIDLHEEKVPGVLRSALGQRAAKDLTAADIDQAISNRRALLVASAAGLQLVVLILLFFLFGPGPFRSLVGRALAPFRSGEAIATRTQVQVVRPEGGDAQVTIGSPVVIVAEVTGRRPEVHAKDAPCLLYRHDESEPFRKRYLQYDAGDSWTTTVSPVDVGNGIEYKVTAGDGETPIYRITVRAAPLISDFLATYHYRPYLQRAARSRITRKLEDLRGTEVHLLARTNRVIKEGRLDFEGQDGVGSLLRPELMPDDPQALRFKFTLERPGKYRIRFTSSDGEMFLDPVSHDVVILPDHVPQVALTQPGKDVELPAQGHLELVGEASDDNGIAAMALRVQVVGGAILGARPYLAGRLGQGDLGTPRRIDYRDLLELDRLVDDKGQPFQGKPGMVLEYWLEATDACDVPQPNLGKSARFKITLTEGKAGANQDKDRAAARDRKGQHDKQQGEQLKNEKAERDQQRQREEQQEKEEGRKREDKQNKSGKQEGKNEGDKPEDGKEQGKPESQQGNKEGTGEQPGGQADNKNQDPNKEPGKESKNDNQTREQAENLKRALDNRNQENRGQPNKKNDPGENATQKENDSGKDKGGEARPGEARGDGENKPGESKSPDKKPGQDPPRENKPGEQKGAGDKPERAGEKKEQGGQEGKNNAGESKDAGKPEGQEGQGQGKEGSRQEGPNQPKPGESKTGEGKQSGKPNEGAGNSKSEPQGKGKEGGRPEQQRQAGEGKPEEKGKPGEPGQKGEGKQSAQQGKAGQENGPAEKKEGSTTQGGEKKGEGKTGQSPENRPMNQEGGSSQAKPTDKAPTNGEAKPGSCKNCPNGGQASADGSKPGESKGGSNQRAKGKGNPQDATKNDVQELAQELKNSSGAGREATRQELEQIQNQARDAEAREAARQALQDQGKDQPGQAKPDAAPGKSGGKPGDAKPDEGMGQAQAAGKAGAPEGMGGGEDGKPTGKAGAEKPQPGNAPGVAKSEETGTANKPGEGQQGDRRGGSGSSDGDAQPVRKEKAGQHRATMMQLEEFRKKVDRDVLKDARMSKEEFARFLEDYQNLARRQAQAKDEPDLPPGPGRNSALPSMGGSVIKKTGGAGNGQEVRSEGRPTPPPEYRDAHRDFLNRLLTPSR
ncbi:MAG: hypothetical protein U0840_04915 [Gemmataceae bacterium]